MTVTVNEKKKKTSRHDYLTFSQHGIFKFTSTNNTLRTKKIKSILVHKY